MSHVRCHECHATMVVPEALQASTMKCGYCGAVLPVPDLAARQAAMLEHRRLDLAARELELAAQHRREQEARAARREHHERTERKRSARWGRVATLLSMLLAPAIVSVTVFDLPARLGFGDSGEDRLRAVAGQLAVRGCREAVAPSSTYATGAVVRLVPAAPAGAPPCLRVLAAGGPDQRALTAKIFDLDARELASSSASSDPQAEACPAAGTSLRYEVVPGVAAKGRLSHLALWCPAPDAASAPAAPPAGERSRRRPR